jgi:hypothetical protein
MHFLGAKNLLEYLQQLSVVSFSFYFFFLSFFLFAHYMYWTAPILAFIFRYSRIDNLTFIPSLFSSPRQVHYLASDYPHAGSYWRSGAARRS